MPWLIKHAALLINVCKVGEDGRTSWERRKGKRFKRQLPEIGECVWFLKALTEGKEKLDTRWEDGIFAGVREEAGEIYVMSSQGVRKVRSYKRRPEGERWNQEEFSQALGTPWEPEPGRNHIEVKARFSMKDDEVDEKVDIQSREFKPRGIYIRRGDLRDERYGMTPGCKGCEAANRGVSGVHNERCRLRIEQAIESKEPDRYARVMARLKTESKKDEVSATPLEQDEEMQEGKGEGGENEEKSSSSNMDISNEWNCPKCGPLLLPPLLVLVPFLLRPLARTPCPFCRCALLTQQQLRHHTTGRRPARRWHLLLLADSQALF